MHDLNLLWLRTLEHVGDLAAHEIKDTLNGVSLSLEVVRGRSGDNSSVSSFAATAAGQLDLVTARVDAMLALARRPKEPADVALTLRRLAAVLVPAAKAEGGALAVEGADGSVETRVSAQATRLALASAILATIGKDVVATCRLESANGHQAATDSKPNGAVAVVRFSHESADVCRIDAEIAQVIGEEGVQIERGENGRDLLLAFPGRR